ncbi:MAG: hypothetical protein A3F31_04595 [Candidatus Levybacteria bacterium RIFCSPHIGHO2_12_FULL_38_12]|nr:MAG: hypothetical protein A3F31_04595 [Candidatus Levybacteria bacterium RIFCSPHIGHO2_12_FULL_38_12]
MKKLVLLDIDHTLFDTQLYRNALFGKIASVLVDAEHVEDTSKLAEKVCSDIISKRGYFDTEEFIKQFIKHIGREEMASIIREFLINKVLMEDHLYSDVIPSLKELEKLGKIGILSQGEDAYQRAKLSSFEHFLHPDFIFIAKDKKNIMKTIFSNKDYKMYFVDDTLEMLYHAFLQNKNVITIWMKWGRLADDQKEIPWFRPAATVYNFDQAIEVVKNT